ncbi:MAG: serine--tRNA ligase [Candidatus Levybacteria bacterium RIFCSPHIGHO2_01_FULL_40_15b]|nr:MAG: serine--tRNA ligase [Candidatus Levybacteria bacterium RIFCSPHIGHO2_01_FULL_40_15b]
MLDIKFIRENPDKVRAGAKSKNIEINIDEILKLDEEVRIISRTLQELYTQKNRAAKERDVEGGREIKTEVDSSEDKLRKIKEKLGELLYAIPNLPAPDVKIGKGESQNEVIRKHGTPRKFDFEPRDHVEIGEILDIIDIERAAKVSGTRFAYLKNEGVLLEFALAQFAFDSLIKEGFIPVIPPELIKTEIMKSLGYMERGGAEDMFHIEKDGLTLVGTAEHAIVAMHMDETFLERDLPKRYVGFSSAFRREAGSYGKDTRGILRVHQFDKVEMVSYTTPEKSDEEHEYLVSIEERFFQALKIPYQVVKMCTADLGFVQARKYDLEAWIPSQEKYREVTSASHVTDFQARRLNIRYLPAGRQGQNGSGKDFVHTLNATGFAIGRTLIAILENYQEADGSVIVPEVLRNYINLDKISPKNK